MYAILNPIIHYKIACMQYKNEKSLQIIRTLGQIIKDFRVKNLNKSLNTFSYEYELTPGNVSRIENGQIEPKIVMLWRIAEALGIPLSDIIKHLEDELGEDFSLSDKLFIILYKKFYKILPMCLMFAMFVL